MSLMGRQQSHSTIAFLTQPTGILPASYLLAA